MIGIHNPLTCIFSFKTDDFVRETASSKSCGGLATSTVISNDDETFNVVEPVVNDRGIGQRLWTVVGAIKVMMMVIVRIVVNQQDDIIMGEVGRAFIDMGRARGASMSVREARGRVQDASQVLVCSSRKFYKPATGEHKRTSTVS